MLWPCERAEKSAEHQLETVLRILLRQVRNGRLFPDDELDLRNEVDYKLAVGTHRLQNGPPPLANLPFAFHQNLADQCLERLCQGCVWNVAFVLVKLAGGEEAARRNERLMQLVDYRRFADTGITGDEHKLGCAAGHDPVEGREQRVDLALPPVQLS